MQEYIFLPSIKPVITALPYHLCDKNAFLKGTPFNSATHGGARLYGAIWRTAGVTVINSSGSLEWDIVTIGSQQQQIRQVWRIVLEMNKNNFLTSRRSVHQVNPFVPGSYFSSNFEM